MFVCISWPFHLIQHVQLPSASCHSPTQSIMPSPHPLPLAVTCKWPSHIIKTYALTTKGWGLKPPLLFLKTCAKTCKNKSNDNINSCPDGHQSVDLYSDLQQPSCGHRDKSTQTHTDIHSQPKSPRGLQVGISLFVPHNVHYNLNTNSKHRSVICSYILTRINIV